MNITWKIKNVTNRARITLKHHRNSFWNIDKVISLLKKHKNKRKYFYINNVKIKTSTSKNNIVVKNYEKWNNKCKCDICGIEATYFVLEKADNIDVENNLHHFNLYTIDKDSKIEIYFNLDHIKPKSKGGNNELENLQLTCENCNTKKGNMYEEVKIIKKESFLKRIFNKLFK